MFAKAFLLFTRAASQSVTVHSIPGNTPRDAQNLYQSYKFAKHILSRYGNDEQEFESARYYKGVQIIVKTSLHNVKK